jgi:hypothetical protein
MERVYRNATQDHTMIPEHPKRKNLLLEPTLRCDAARRGHAEAEPGVYAGQALKKTIGTFPMQGLVQ